MESTIALTLAVLVIISLDSFNIILVDLRLIIACSYVLTEACYYFSRDIMIVSLAWNLNRPQAGIIREGGSQCSL